MGPGIKDKCMPGWPKNPDSEFNEADIAGHEVVEISRNDFDMEIGGMGAWDYFGDGSFYILDAPGVRSPFADPSPTDSENSTHLAMLMH